MLGEDGKCLGSERVPPIVGRGVPLQELVRKLEELLMKCKHIVVNHVKQIGKEIVPGCVKNHTIPKISHQDPQQSPVLEQHFLVGLFRGRQVELQPELPARLG